MIVKRVQQRWQKHFLYIPTSGVLPSHRTLDLSHKVSIHLLIAAYSGVVGDPSPVHCYG